MAGSGAFGSDIGDAKRFFCGCCDIEGSVVKVVELQKIGLLVVMSNDKAAVNDAPGRFHEDAYSSDEPWNHIWSTLLPRRGHCTAAESYHQACGGSLPKRQLGSLFWEICSACLACPSVRFSGWLPACLFVCMFVCLSGCLSVPPVYVTPRFARSGVTYARSSSDDRCRLMPIDFTRDIDS